MFLKPSNIFFSQDSINNVFDKRCNHSYKPIGETLDEICEGRCSVSNIPTISVVLRDGKWMTADNRRLWVFRELERLGKCDKVFVQKGYYIPESKLTSENGGVTVQVRGSPGGFWHRKSGASKLRTNASISSSHRDIYGSNSPGITTNNFVTNTCQIPEYRYTQNESSSRSIPEQSDQEGFNSHEKTFGRQYDIQKERSSSSEQSDQEGFNSYETTFGQHYNKQNERSQRVYRHKTYDRLRNNTPYNTTYTVEDKCCCIIL